MLSGASAGAMIGSAIMPGIGTAIGAAAGAAAGFLSGLFGDLFGDHGRDKAKKYDEDSLRPAIAKEMAQYNAGMAGYNQVAQDLQNLYNSAQQTTSSYGSGARSYFGSTMAPEIAAAHKALDREEKGGRAAIHLQAAQFHGGGWIGGFGDMGTSATEGFIQAMTGEHVTQSRMAAINAPVLNAINNGANVTALLSGMMGSSRGSARAAVTVNFNINAQDSRSFDSWARNGGAMITDAGFANCSSEAGPRVFAAIGDAPH
jgi:hypothetical protein